jgi:ELWxxDGT repeat protein
MKKVLLGIALMAICKSINAQPQMVADIKPGAASSNPAKLTILGNKMVIFTDMDIYTYDGNALSASLFTGIGYHYSYQSVPYPVLGDKVYFDLMSPSMNNPSELVPWLCNYDGTTFTPISECYERTSVGNPFVVDNSIYSLMGYSIRRTYWPSYNSLALWGNYMDTVYGDYGVLASNNNIFFCGDSLLFEIWPSVNQCNNVSFSELVIATAPRPSTFITASDKKIYFSSNTDTAGRVLFSLDTNYLASKVSNLPNGGFPDLNALGYEKGIIQMGNYLYFGANDGTHGMELMRMNLTNNNIELIKDINTGAGDSYPCQMALFNNKLYFSAFNASTGRELYSCDAGGNVTLVYDLKPGTANSNPRNLTVFKNELYFSASNATSGVELFRLGNPVSIRDAAKEVSNLSLFPNPTTTDVHLKFSLAKAGALNLNIRDINGKLLYAVPSVQYGVGEHNILIPAGRFANGIYIYELGNSEGHIISKGRFVKQ